MKYFNLWIRILVFRNINISKILVGIKIVTWRPRYYCYI